MGPTFKGARVEQVQGARVEQVQGARVEQAPKTLFYRKICRNLRVTQMFYLFWGDCKEISYPYKSLPKSVHFQ